MNVDYHSTIITYDRHGATVTPHVCRYEWQPDRFGLAFTTNVRWRDIRRESAPEPWWSARPSSPTRSELLEAGIIREAGHGMPYLRCY